MVSNVAKLCINIIVAMNIHRIASMPGFSTKGEETKTKVQKIGEIEDLGAVITLDQIKLKLKESHIFNVDDPTLTETERKELNKLFNAVEIMSTSRARQPSHARNMFWSLRLVERAVKKQAKEGQISTGLAAKFHWENLFIRSKTSFKSYEKGLPYKPTHYNTSGTKSTQKFKTTKTKPNYYLDKATKMRVFNVSR